MAKRARRVEEQIALDLVTAHHRAKMTEIWHEIVNDPSRFASFGNWVDLHQDQKDKDDGGTVLFLITSNG